MRELVVTFADKTSRKISGVPAGAMVSWDRNGLTLRISKEKDLLGVWHNVESIYDTSLKIGDVIEKKDWIN